MFTRILKGSVSEVDSLAQDNVCKTVVDLALRDLYPPLNQLSLQSQLTYVLFLTVVWTAGTSLRRLCESEVSTTAFVVWTAGASICRPSGFLAYVTKPHLSRKVMRHMLISWIGHFV